MKKLLLTIIVLLLTIQVAYAIGINPSVTINADPVNATTFSTIVATAVDALDNAGIEWVKIYKNGSLLEKKDCEGKSLCTFIKIDYERNIVNHTYYAETKDIDGNTKTSQTITVSYSGNQYPVLQPISNITVNEGDLVNLTPYINASDPDNNTLTIDVSAPFDISGALVNDSFTYQTNYNDAGVYNVVVRASDDSGDFTEQNFTLTIIDVPTLSVTLDSPANGSILSTSNVTFNCSAVSFNNATLVNITLYSNINGTWQPEQTNTVSGTSNSTTFTLTNISDGIYEWNCLVTDENSTTMSAPSNYTFTIDATAPVISNVQVSNITNESAVINWTTDELSDSEVNFGNESGNYTAVFGDVTLVQNHSILLFNLQPNTLYYFAVTSRDALNNTAQSIEYNFTTLPNPSPYNFNMTDPADQSVNVTENATYPIVITNTGSVPISINLTVNNTDNATTAQLSQYTITGLAPTATNTIFLTVGDSTPGNYTVIIDGVSTNDPSVTYQVNITTYIVTGPTNNAPTFDTAPVNANIQVNNTFTYDINASDLDGDNLTFSDDAAQFDINSSTGLINFTPTVVELIQANITVCDDSGAANNCTTQSFSLNVTAGPTNNAPTFDTVPVNANIQVNNTFTYDINASDLDGDNLTFSDNAAQFNIDANTGLINFTPSVVELIQANITVCDDSGAANNCTNQSFSLNVLSTGIPTTGNIVINEFLADGVVPATEDDEFIELYNNDSMQINISGWNIGDAASNYTIPAGTLLNPSQFVSYNRSVSSIALNNGGDTIYLYDSLGNLTDSYAYASSTENVSFGRYPDGTNNWTSLIPTPGAANTPPAPNNAPYFISPVVDANIQVNNTFLFDVDTGDADVGDTLTHYDNAAQFDINPNLGYINFTPTVVEVITATITVCDDSGAANNCTTQPFSLNVTAGPTNNAPQFTTPAVNTNIEVDNLFTYDINAIDLDVGDNITFSDNAAQFDINSSTGLINFTPTVVELIQANITVCDDSGFPNNCTSQLFVLNVTPGAIYGVNMTDPADQTVNTATNAVYSITITNTGNVPDSYNLTVNNLDNATTATLSQYTITNLAAGAPNSITLTVGDSTPGNYTVEVNVTSVNDPNATAQVNITTTVSAITAYGVDVSDPTGQTVDTLTNAVYSITVSNTGNVADSYTLTVNNTDNASTALLNQTTVVNLAPSASTNVTLTVGDSTLGTYDVTVTAVSQTNSTATDTTAIITTIVNQAQGDLTGTVTDSDNNIYSATVELYQGVSLIRTTTTDASGQYSFTNLNAEDYNISITKPGYNDNVQSITITTSPNTHNAVLTPAAFAGTISGNVIDGTDGITPIVNATVTITRSDNAQVMQIVRSDALGAYVINGLPPTVGFTYDLDATAVGYTNTFPPTGISLTPGETKTGQDIYMI